MAVVAQWLWGQIPELQQSHCLPFVSHYVRCLINTLNVLALKLFRNMIYSLNSAITMQNCTCCMISGWKKWCPATRHQSYKNHTKRSTDKQIDTNCIINERIQEPIWGCESGYEKRLNIQWWLQYIYITFMKANANRCMDIILVHFGRFPFSLISLCLFFVTCDNKDTFVKPITIKVLLLWYTVCLL